MLFTASAVVLFGACSGGDGGTSSSPMSSDTVLGGVVDSTDLPMNPIDALDGSPDPTPLPELADPAGGCEQDAVEVPGGWPFVVPDGIIVTETSVEQLRYHVLGVTTDGERSLVDALDVTFNGFDAEETEAIPGSDLLVLELTSDTGRGSIELIDRDDDGCWAIRLVLVLNDSPAELVPSEPPGTVEDPLDPLSAVGRGEATTGRGTSALFVTVCQFTPLRIDAASSSGQLELRGSGADTSARWVHPDGVEVVDDEARVLSSSPSSIAVAFVGPTPDGLESVIVDLQCDDS